MLSSWSQTSPAQARFAGNGFDGYASSKMLSSWLQAKPTRFFGGSFDGYDRNAALGIPNWTTGDTDGNGLPDWWELKYFGVLTGTDPNADPDHDGVSNLHEYFHRHKSDERQFLFSHHAPDARFAQQNLRLL